MSSLIPFVRRQTLNNWVYDLDRLFEPMLQEANRVQLQGEIHETDEHIMMSFDFPGLKEEDFKVSLEGDVLTISGERKREEKSQGEGVRFFGRQYGKFYRAFSLPETVDKEKIDADYRDGVLRVLLPKQELKKEHAIEVKVKSKNSVFDRLLGSK